VAPPAASEFDEGLISVVLNWAGPTAKHDCSVAPGYSRGQVRYSMGTTGWCKNEQPGLLRREALETIATLQPRPGWRPVR